MGRLNEKVAPISLFTFDTHIFPPWALIRFFDMYKPKPTPISDTNFENSVSSISGSIPEPLYYCIRITKKREFRYNS